VDLESIRDPQLSSIPLSFDTLGRFRNFFPAHCDLPDYRLYPPGDCLQDGNLVAFIQGTYTSVYGGITWYLGKRSSHSFKIIPAG
jgi:hypothetical protein